MCICLVFCSTAYLALFKVNMKNRNGLMKSNPTFLFWKTWFHNIQQVTDVKWVCEQFFNFFYSTLLVLSQNFFTNNLYVH